MTGTGRSDTVTRVDDVLITAELEGRPSRNPDYKAESRALGLLAEEMATNPSGVLQKCAELVMDLCHADSAGISILEPGGTSGMLRWHAAAGGFAPNLHGAMPREGSPCGTVMERNCVLLFREAERFYPALRGVEPRIYENLLAPWHVKGTAAGTVWAIKHTPDGRFDAEDARLLQSLARFAAAAFQMTSALDESTAERSALQATEQALRESEGRARLLLAELQHRVRNILGMVRSVVRRTIETGESVEDIADHLDGRLSSLARAQIMLTRSAGTGVDLESLILEELLAQNADETAVAVNGPTIELAPKAAEVLTLAVHELATNATKYGAFAHAGATLEVSWTVESDDGGRERLRLVWQEHGVALTTGAPRRIGFGTELIQRRVPYELHGTGEIELRAGGLRAEIVFPLVAGESILATNLPRSALLERGA